MVDWDSFRDTVRETHSSMFDFETVTVYNYTGGYSPSSGETSWTRDSGTAVDAEIVEGQPDVISNNDGLVIEDGDADMHIRDDAPVDLYPVGTDAQKPTEIEADGSTYKVADVFDEGNGLLLLVCVEVTG